MADYNETFLGDLSDLYNNPTAHEFFPGELVLFVGSNIVTGSTLPMDMDPTDPKIREKDPIPPDRDFFTFEVPSGFTVNAIILDDYDGPGNSYFALIDENAFPESPDDDDGNVIDITDAPFKISKLIDDDELGRDLLEPGVGELDSSGPGQLGPDTYTVWYQETGGPTSYSFDIQLTAPVGANYGQIQFDPSSFSVDEGAGTFDITLRRAGGSDGNVGVVLRRFGGTASNLSDFNFHPVTAIFKQGETERTFTYPLIDDALIESDETAIFELTRPMGGVTIGPSNRATMTILDNDSPSPKVFKFEAEDLTRDTYLIEANEFASAGELVSLKDATGTTGSVSTLPFDGAADTYYAIVRYVDETDGTSTLDFKVNGTSIERWTLDKDLGFWGAAEQSFTERLISGIELAPGDVISMEGIKDRNEETRIDSIHLVAADQFFLYEAEDMALATYLIEENEFASDGQLISLRDAPGDMGTASTNFDGPSGTYDITVGYLDETDGEAQLELLVDGVSIDNWVLDKDLGNPDPFEQTFIEREIRGVSLNNGSTMTIEGELDGFEWARVDFIRVVPSML